MGISTERAYRELLTERKATPVIDGGTDVTYPLPSSCRLGFGKDQGGLLPRLYCTGTAINW